MPDYVVIWAFSGFMFLLIAIIGGISFINPDFRRKVRDLYSEYGNIYEGIISLFFVILLIYWLDFKGIITIN